MISKVDVVFQCSQHAMHTGQNWVMTIFFQVLTVFDICVYLCLQVIVFSIGDSQKKLVYLKTDPTVTYSVAVFLVKMSNVHVFKIQLWQLDDPKSVQHV